MCRVEESGSKGKRTGDLCGVALLETGAPFEAIEDKEVWHPVWKGKIDNTVNVQFIKIWEIEQVSIYIFLSAYVLIFCVEDLERSQWEGRNCHRQFLLVSNYRMCEDLLEEYSQAVPPAT